MTHRLVLSLALGAALLAAPGTLAAQRTIQAGQTVNGRLETSDPKLDDNSHYDEYTYAGRAGDRITITLRSGDFDTYMHWGRKSGSTFTSEGTDDDGAGGTDSQLTVTVGSGGTYVIRANSLAAGATGAYTLSVQRAGGASPQPQQPQRPIPANGQPGITAGQTVSGRLDASDRKLDDNSYFDEYVYTGRPGERITITLRSGDFDTYLHWGRKSGSTFTSEGTDDDGAGGTDSQLTVTVGSGGTYVIRANSLTADATGAYTLSVQSGGGSAPQPGPGGNQPRPGGTGTISAGQTVNGTLSASDPRLTDNSYYDDYTYTGRPGEQIIITLRSSTFDTYLVWGTGSGASFRADTTDDDGGGGTDSQLRVTVGNGGTYTVRANSLAASTTGAYTLEVRSATASRPGPSRPGGGTIAAGETVNGTLTASDPKLSDNSYYDQYVYSGRPGEQIVVTLTSGDFDAWLRGGRLNGREFVLVDQDDDGAGGTNARFQATVGPTGTYVIQANTLRPATTGSYTLRVEAAGGAPAGAATIAMGQTVSGRITAGDPVMSDNSHYKLYVYRGTPGEQVLVTMRSTDFDAYMSWGRLSGSDFTAEQNDDDSGGGTNAQIVATVGSSGTYAVRANTLRAGDTGAFTLTVEPASRAAQRTTPAPAGAATVRSGQTVSGTLTRSSPMLSDSSFYNQYVYSGRPGDRLQITLRSTGFDAYLRWGHLNGSTFQEDAHDDDGAGGTDAQLTVTVGGTGTYVVQANAFAPGTTGAYTLTVQPVSAAPATPATTAGRTGGSAGKWNYAYVDAANPVFRPVAQRLKQGGMFETLAADLNQRFPLPRNIALRSAECGRINAFYSPRNAAVTLCYELLQHLSGVFASQNEAQRRESIDGAVTFIMMHEIGHALVDVMDLPVTGREEDAVDQLATVMLVSTGEKGAQAALNGVLAIQPGANATFDNSDFADEHSLGPQRYFNVACWIYGSDPQKYRGLVGGNGLPVARAERCPGEYQRLSKAWIRLLEENAGGPR